MASNPFFESELFNELNDALRHSSRFTATYRIAADDYAEAKKIARGIAVEQTVECPDELFVNTWIEDSIIGQIEDLKKAEPRLLLRHHLLQSRHRRRRNDRTHEHALRKYKPPAGHPPYVL